MSTTTTDLADALEGFLRANRGKTSCKVDSEEQSVLVAHELKKRGWKASSGRAVLMQTDLKGEMRLAWVVKVTGRRAGAK